MRCFSCCCSSCCARSCSCSFVSVVFCPVCAFPGAAFGVVCDELLEPEVCAEEFCVCAGVLPVPGVAVEFCGACGEFCCAGAEPGAGELCCVFACGASGNSSSADCAHAPAGNKHAAAARSTIREGQSVRNRLAEIKICSGLENRLSVTGLQANNRERERVKEKTSPPPKSCGLPRKSTVPGNRDSADHSEALRREQDNWHPLATERDRALCHTDLDSSCPNASFSEP